MFVEENSDLVDARLTGNTELPPQLFLSTIENLYGFQDDIMRSSRVELLE